MEREREAFGRVVWRWVIRVLWVRIERRVVVEMNIGVVVAVAEDVAMVENERLQKRNKMLRSKFRLGNWDFWVKD